MKQEQLEEWLSTMAANVSNYSREATKGQGLVMLAFFVGLTTAIAKNIGLTFEEWDLHFTRVRSMALLELGSNLVPIKEETRSSVDSIEPFGVTRVKFAARGTCKAIGITFDDPSDLSIEAVHIGQITHFDADHMVTELTPNALERLSIGCIAPGEVMTIAVRSMRTERRELCTSVRFVAPEEDWKDTVVATCWAEFKKLEARFLDSDEELSETELEETIKGIIRQALELQ